MFCLGKGSQGEESAEKSTPLFMDYFSYEQKHCCPIQRFFHEPARGLCIKNREEDDGERLYI